MFPFDDVLMLILHSLSAQKKNSNKYMYACTYIYMKNKDRMFKVQNGLFNQKSSLGVQTTNQQEKSNLKNISISFDNS